MKDGHKITGAEWNAHVAKLNSKPPVRSSEIVPPRDCCANWTRSGRTIEGIAVIEYFPGIRELDMRFRFCPWCGHARGN